MNSKDAEMDDPDLERELEPIQILNPPQQTVVKSWAELRDDIRNIRGKLSSSLSYRLPHSFVFKKISESLDPLTRIYFISNPPYSGKDSVYAIDVPELAPIMFPPKPPRVIYPWIQVLPSKFQDSAPLSNEKSWPMERNWITPTPPGITAYNFHEKSAKFVFTKSSVLFECIDNTIDKPLKPTEIRTPHSSSGARINPEICPIDPNLIAYVNHGDIFVVNSASGFELQLTHARKPREIDTEAEPVYAGHPSFVMQEEFQRFNGFWWQPNSDDGLFRILYEEVNESEVNVVKLLPLPGQQAEVYRFPTAGTPNAKSTLRIIQFDVVEGFIEDVVNYEPEHNIPEFFGWTEYVVRAGWTPDGRFIFVQLLNREQKKLEVVLFPSLPARSKRKNESRVPGPSAPAYVIYSESTNVWINVHDMLVFLPCEDPNAVQFLWASEETGFRHIYSIKSALCPCIGGSWNSWDDKPGTEIFEIESYTQTVIPLTPTVLEKVQLTWGDWEVLNSPLRLNHSLGLVFFTGLRDTPIERHLYVTSFRVPTEPLRLTNPGFSCTAILNSEATLAVLTYSATQASPLAQLFRIQYNGKSNGFCRVTDVKLEPITYFNYPKQIDTSLVSTPEICSYRLGSGEELFVMIYKPVNFNPTKKYPTILYVYGGPEVQLVYNTFKGTSQLLLYLLASQGYCVISIDSRGSHHRGVRFESHIHYRMGTVELDDQVDILTLMADKNPFIDMERVGIYGWSYGGYLSLMGLAQYPHVFKVCVAGAPVTSWDLYDTGYTERYMGLPVPNSGAYKRSSVLTYIHQFPEEEDRLLIIHGLVDENVHFTHTTLLINSLVQAGKPHQLQMYPNERHSLQQIEASEHYETMLLSFLQRCL